MRLESRRSIFIAARTLIRSRHVLTALFSALAAHSTRPVESRCDELRQMSESLVSSLRISFRSQLTSLPLRVRQMPLAEFAGSQHAGSVVSVMEEQVRTRVGVTNGPRHFYKLASNLLLTNMLVVYMN